MEPSSSLCTGASALEILAKYHELWGCQMYPGRNPAPQPTSLERDNFATLLQHDYVVSDKSDGARFVLFLARTSDREVAVLVDRKLTLYQVPVAASKSHFSGSIYDGELVLCGGSHVFLVFDAVAHKGRYVGNQTFLKRLEVIRGVFDLAGDCVRSPEDASRLAKQGKVVCGGSVNGLTFRPKPFFQIRQLDTLLRQLPQLPYRVDGLIFTPTEACVQTGTHDSLFKFKQTHSVDVEVDAEGESLLVGMGGSPATATRRVPLSSLGLVFRLHPALESILPTCCGMILELQVVLAAAGGGGGGGERDALFLSFIGIRRDKAHPNAAATVVRTIKNVREALTTDDLLEIAQKAGEQQDLRRALVA